MEGLEYKRNTTTENAQFEAKENTSIFVDELNRVWDVNLTNIFSRQKDIKVADAVLHMFRMKENIDILDFELTAEEMEEICTLQKGKRFTLACF